MTGVSLTKTRLPDAAHAKHQLTLHVATFTYLAPKLWNSLPDNVQGSDTLSV